ncbi:glycosyl hydrolase family 18 protein [Massilia sp. CCM 9210]|uniref:glycosyl hydrolase family 18 protein n=1 Tax=Massilia scottii TaxID=3057166 RepID=UPI0027967A59|nr:glycosyl hydrolase family 18 protein [Massilia sp. CCM 9210]MDQ1813055.1 glycosyl hydrolase family 18 protein [Massilia sp. CCM 9210]
MKKLLKYLGMAAIGGAIISGCGGASSDGAPTAASPTRMNAAVTAEPLLPLAASVAPGATSSAAIDGLGTDSGSSAALAPCTAVTWRAGVNYPLGTVVLYTPNGLYYKVVQVAGNGSDGTTPTISTWYWAQTTCALPAAKKIVGGYYPNWTPSPVRIRDVNARYNLIYLFHAVPVGGSPGTTGAVTFSAPGNGRGAATNLNADIQYARSTQGRKIILSVGGAGNGMSFPNRTKSQTFVNSIASIYSQLGGIDGMDWNTFEADQRPDTAEMIWISLELKKRYPGFIISAPPAPWNAIDKEFCRAMVAAGAMDYAAPQYYDGPGLNDPAYVAENVKQWVSLLGANRVVVGFGISNAANYMSREQAVSAWNQVKANHPDIRGGFNWQIHTDEEQGWPFANSVAPLINP